MRRSKGFTLIEILIVVMIIAILASLVLPRMLEQVDRAGRSAEAFEWMGVIRRAAEKMQTLTGTYTGNLDSAAGASPATSGSWGSLGLQEPSGIKQYRVIYNGNGMGYDASVVWGGWDWIRLDYELMADGSEVWACGWGFKPVKDGAGKVIGCTYS